MTTDELREWRAGLRIGSRIGYRMGDQLWIATLHAPDREDTNGRLWSVVFDRDTIQYEQALPLALELEVDLDETFIWCTAYERDFLPLPHPEAKGVIDIRPRPEPRRRRASRAARAPKAPKRARAGA